MITVEVLSTPLSLASKKHPSRYSARMLSMLSVALIVNSRFFVPVQSSIPCTHYQTVSADCRLGFRHLFGTDTQTVFRSHGTSAQFSKAPEHPG